MRIRGGSRKYRSESCALRILCRDTQGIEGEGETSPCKISINAYKFGKCKLGWLGLRLIFLAAFLFVSCSPLRPLAPVSQNQNSQTSTSTTVPSSKDSKSASNSKNEQTAANANSQTITGISAWDKVLSPWLGTPYLYGGTSRNGVDCSGFVSSVYAEKEKLYIPRTSKEEFKQGISVEKSNLSVGDLVFFGDGGVVNHVGIYVGGGKMIHASTSLGVTVTPLSDSYWVPRYMGARRYL